MEHFGAFNRMNSMLDPNEMTDQQILDTLERLADEERQRLPYFLACLGIADSKKLPETRGYESTFDYCVKRLKLSEGEAYRRIHAARAANHKPELYSALKDGILNLSTVSKLAPHIRRPDASDLISQASNKSFREVEKMVAPLTPERKKRDSVRAVAVFVERKLAEAQTSAASAMPPTDAPPIEASLVSAETEPPPPAAPPYVKSSQESGAFQLPAPAEPSRAVEVRIDFHFQGSVALRDAIDRAKELLAHKFPIGRLGEILQEVLLDYLDRNDPQRALKLGRLGPVPGRATIPAAVRRAVWARDGGRCSYVGTTGQRCIARRALELDHRRPRALGGRDTVDNLRLLCRPHNDAERRRLLGEGRRTPARPARRSK